MCIHAKSLQRPTLRTIAHQASLSMWLSRQEYWSRLLCPLPGDLPSSRGSSWPRDLICCLLCLLQRQVDSLTLAPLGKLRSVWKWMSLSHVWLFATPWTVQSMEFSRSEYGSGKPIWFPTQGSNPGLPHCGQILHLPSHKGSRRILEWVAYPFSSGSSRPRNQTRVSCIASGFFPRGASIHQS